MKLTEFIAIIISLISLILSVVVAYLSFFQPSKIKVLVGNNLVFFNSYIEDSVGKTWGGLSFYLPISFYNWNRKGGEIHQIRIVLGRLDNPMSYFDMVWANFAQLSKNKVRLMEDIDIAQPVAIGAQSSISKILRFNLSPFTQSKLEIKPGNYELMVFGWTRNGGKPDLIKNLSFQIDDTQAKEYQNHVAKDLSLPILVPLGDNRLPNNILTKKDVLVYYGNTKI